MITTAQLLAIVDEVQQYKQLGRAPDFLAGIYYQRLMRLINQEETK